MRVCMRCRSLYQPGAKFCGIDGQELVDFREDPLIGQRIDRYKVVSLLGRGASASVYKVVHNALETELALKVLHGHLGADAMFVARFRREAQVVSRIRSPRVVSVLDFGTSQEGLTYLVMEYCAGTTLDRLIASERMFDPARAARITSQVADGLAAAHRMGFVHRDVKPGNIAVEVDGGKEQAKLLDFGIVRMPEIESSDRLTKQGTVMGTPPYMSPEQADGREVTDRADLYSLGVVLYEMLSGRKPFLGTTAELFYKHHHDAPPALPVTGPIADLAYALLAKEPVERPAGATVVAERAKKIEIDLRGGDPSLDPAGEPAAIPFPPPTPPTEHHPGIATGGPATVQAHPFTSNQGLSLPHRRLPIVVLSTAVAAFAIGLGAAWWSYWRVPAPKVVQMVDPGPSLGSMERTLAQVLEQRGLTEGDLPTLAGTEGVYHRWQGARAGDAMAAREALSALIAAAQSAPIETTLLLRRLDGFDTRVAERGSQLPGPDFEALKRDYLDLYRQAQAAESEPAREAVAKKIRAFEQRLAAQALAAPPH